MSDLIDRQNAIDAVSFGITYTKVFDKETGKVKELFAESNYELKNAIDRIKELPSVDAVEVVRCKDCKNWGRTWRRHPPDYHYCPFIDYMTSESFYCAKAERRTDELGITN